MLATRRSCFYIYSEIASGLLFLLVCRQQTTKEIQVSIAMCIYSFGLNSAQLSNRRFLASFNSDLAEHSSKYQKITIQHKSKSNKNISNGRLLNAQCSPYWLRFCFCIYWNRWTVSKRERQTLYRSLQQFSSMTSLLFSSLCCVIIRKENRKILFSLQLWSSLGPFTFTFVNKAVYYLWR